MIAPTRSSPQLLPPQRSRAWLQRLVWGVLTLVAAGGCRPATELARDGFLVQTYTDAKGEEYHYVVFVPPRRAAEEKLPVILFLNGWGENGHDGLRQISNNFGGDVWRLRGQFPFLAVCPQCRYHGSWTPGTENALRAISILESAIDKFGGDPDRVFVTGASAGGDGAMALASAEPERFAAVAPVAVGHAGIPSRLGAGGMPIWAFYNNKDVQGLVLNAERCRRELMEAGLSPLYSDFDESGHNAWDAAYGSPALFAWLLRQNRRDPRRAVRFELLAAERLLQEWASEGAAIWSAAETGELFGLASAGGGGSRRVSPPQQGDAELHADVWLDATGSARIGLLLTDGQHRELLLELTERGTGGLLDDAGGLAAALDPCAQRRLRPGWNDVRLTRREGQLSVLTNGWPALEMDDPGRGAAFHWTLPLPESRSGEWRFVRLRQLAAAADGGSPASQPPGERR